MPNEYSDFLDAGTRPAGNNPYADVLDQGAASAQVQVQNAEGSSPDQAAKVAGASRALGIPFAAGNVEPQDTISRVRRQQNSSRVVANPFLQDAVNANPALPHIAEDDWDKLDAVSKAWQVYRDYNPAFMLGRAAMRQGEAIAAGAKAGFAQEGQGVAYASGDTAGAADWQKYAEEQPQFNEGLQYYSRMAGGMLGQLAYQGATGAPKGAAIGMGAGAMLGGVGAGPGAALGAMGGMASVAGQAAYGRTLMALDTAEEQAGQKLDPAAKYGAAAAIGAIAGGANLIGLKVGGEAVGSLLTEATTQAMAKPGVIEAARRFGLEVGKGGAIGAGLMGTMTATEGVLQDAAKSTGGDFATIFNDPAKRQELVANVGHSLADGFLLMGALHAVPAGRNFVNDMRLVEEARQGKEGLDALMAARSESKTWQRDPETLEVALQAHGDDTLTITGDGMAKLAEAQPELAARLAESAMPDGAVEVPVATYAAVVNNAAHAAISDDVVHHADGVSVNEALQLENYHSRTSQFMAEGQPPRAANDAGGVFDTWESRRAGLAESTAEGQPLAGLPDYQTGVPTTVDAFHGTLKDFIHKEGFDDAKLGSATNAPSAGEATFFARNPETSNHYARRQEADHENFDKSSVSAEDLKKLHDIEKEYSDAANAFQDYKEVNGAVDLDHPEMLKLDAAEQKYQDFLDHLAEKYPDAPQLIQSRIKFDNPLVYDFKGQDYREESYFSLIQKAKAVGHDGAVFLNTSDGGPNDVIYAVFDKSKIGHRLDTDARRAASEAQQRMSRSLSGEVLAANHEIAPTSSVGDSSGAATGKDPRVSIQPDQYAKGPNDKSVVPAGVKDEPDSPNRNGINFTEEADRINITGSYLNESARGKGLGVAMYEELARYGQEVGKPIYSDYDISADALRMYEKLKAKGYDVEFAPGAQFDVDGEFAGFKGKFVGGPEDSFTIRINPKERAEPAPVDPVVAAAEAEMHNMYLQPLFPNAKSAGMLEGEFARYSKLLEARAERIRALNERRAARDAAERQTPEYRAREADVRDEVTANVDNRPDIAAERLTRLGLEADGTRVGDMRLDPEIVDAMSRPGTAKLLRGYVVKGGVHPDEVAALTGYGSGAELVVDLVGLKGERERLGLTPAKYRERMIAERTADEMRERFGDLKENIAQEAQEMAIMPQASEILNAEREALAASVGQPMAATLDDLRVAAAQRFAQTTVKQATDLAGFQRAITRAGRQAELALLAGDHAKAFLAKQAQLQAHLLAEQSKAFLQDQRKLERRLQPYVNEPTLKAVSQRYVNQIQGLLTDLGVAIRRDAADLKEVRGAEGDLRSFIDGRNSDLGGLIPNADLPLKSFADYNVEDMRQLQDLVQALDFQGRAEKKIKVGEDRADLEDVVGQMRDQILALPDRYDPQRKGLGATLAAVGRKIDAPLLKQEQVFEWFDHHDPQGLFHKTVVEPLHAAQSLRDDIFTDLGKQLRALQQSKEWNKRLGDSIPNQTLMDNFASNGPVLWNMTRKDLLGIMLNMGNPANFEMLTKGHQWDQQAVRDLVSRNASREDWQWVQGVWNTFKSLEPRIKETYRELAGVGPEMVQPNKVFTKFGTVDGGYFPLIKDTLRAGEKFDETSLFSRNQIQPLPANGYTKARTGAVYPLQINPDFIAANLRAVAHDLAFRGPVIEASKVLMHPSIQRAVKQTFGPEYAAELLPYLKDIANDGVQDLNGIAQLTAFSSGARNAVVSSLIGLNPGTVMIHGVSAGLNSIGEIAHQFGWKAAVRVTPKFVNNFLANTPEAAYQQTLGRIFKSPFSFNAAWREAMDQSAEMRNRMHNFDRDLAIMQDRALGKNDKRAAWNNFATGFVAYSDLLTAVPTFITVRDMALANGKSLEEAIALGEKTVRQAHGSAGIVDRARIQRGNEIGKWFTMFYGYFSHNYNRNRNTWREVTEGKDLLFGKRYAEAGNAALKVTTAAVFYSLLPAVNHAVVRHPKDEEQDYARWMAAAMTTQFTGQFPFLRELGSSLASGFDPQATPMAPAMKSVKTTIENALILSGASHGKMKHGAIKEAVDTAGLISGVGVRQIGKGAQFVYDANTGTEHPDGFWEWVRGLNTGHAKQRKH